MVSISRILSLLSIISGFAVYNSKSPKYSWYSEAVSANITVRVNEDFVSSDKGTYNIQYITFLYLKVIFISKWRLI